jgi:hypothetical protein
VCGFETLSKLNDTTKFEFLLYKGMGTVTPYAFSFHIFSSSEFCQPIYDIKSKSAGVYTAPQAGITIDALGILHVDTSSPIPFVTQYVVATTQGSATVEQEFTVEVCGSEQVVKTMPSTNSSIEFTLEQFEGVNNAKFIYKNIYGHLFKSTSSLCLIETLEIFEIDPSGFVASKN